MRPGRRRLLVSLLAWLALPSVPTSSLAAGQANAVPARLLRVELRCVAEPAGQPQAPPSSAGSVVISSTGAQTRSAGSDRTLRSSDAASPAWPGVELVVANGERAQVRWQDERWLPQVAFAWGAAAGQRPGHGGRPGEPTRPGVPPGPPAAAGGLAVGLGSERQLALRRLEVLPRWPGGSAPVRLSVAAEQSAALDNPPSTPALAVQTEVSLPLGRWTTLARSVNAPEPDGRPSATGALVLQVRVTLAPD